MSAKALLLLCIIISCHEIELSYKIFRNSCRRSSLFKLAANNSKLAHDVLSRSHADRARECLQLCLRTEQCTSINFKKNYNTTEFNCDILSNFSDIHIAAPGWNHYVPVDQSITPGCLVAGDVPACKPGFRCEESCNSAKRHQCIDINECLSNPCRNGGTCLNQENQYRCNCVPGWTGVNCENDLDECASNPCYRGYCHNQFNRYSCSCSGGWTGSRCGIDINECNSSPCVNGGCNNHENHYSCTCNTFWGGQRCDLFFGGK